MNATSATGWLLTLALGHLADAGPKGCCTHCCGTCSALQWLRVNDPTADDCVRATMTHDGDLSYWQHPDGRIDWDTLASSWAVPCEFAEDHESEATK